MRILLDTNVVLDAPLGRTPWAGDAESIWRAHAEARIEACISASSLTDVFYVSRRIAGRDQAWRAVRTCLDQLVILAVGRAEAESAALLKGGDFEDNLQIACAVNVGLEFIVTRDPGGFTDSPVPFCTRQRFLQSSTVPDETFWPLPLPARITDVPLQLPHDAGTYHPHARRHPVHHRQRGSRAVQLLRHEGDPVRLHDQLSGEPLRPAGPHDEE